MKKITFGLMVIAMLVMVAAPMAASAVTVDRGLGTTLELGTADLEATIIKRVNLLLQQIRAKNCPPW